jgi:3-oxoacyl-[acyl-carrier protein] reductase
MTALKNKVVLVTGGAGGIGSAICKRLADEGASVIATYNSNRLKAEQLLGELSREHNATHYIMCAPTTNLEKIRELTEVVRLLYGKVDVLVNNAGITTPVPHHELDALSDEWIDRIFQTNVRGTFAMIRAFKPLMEVDGGLIVNISSVAAVTGIGSNVAYCASKAAVDSITRSLARALAPKIRVVSVSPGWVLGEYAKTVDPAYLKLQQELTPLARLATPEDVANTVFALTTYLTFVTGSIIPVDGGRPLK